MRKLYHIARADFLQRVRSRRLLVVLAVIAYFGYLVNVGQIELVYQIGNEDAMRHVGGVNTAAFIGLKAGLTGSAVFLFGGFYLMKNSLRRDRLHDVEELVASTPVTDLTYLFGKWLSNIALGVVILVVLGFATVVNHAVHGVGPTNVVALVKPLILLALPLGALIGALALVFETVEWLNGTLGNAVYFFVFMPLAVISLAATEGAMPGEIQVWVKATDALGSLAVYDLTVDALLAEVPQYNGGAPSFGTIQADETLVPFRYDGQTWPLWIYAQRTALLLPAIVLVTLATVPFDRFTSTESSEKSGWVSRLTSVLPTLRGKSEDSKPTTEQTALESMSLTPVTDRKAGGFGRLVAAEVRLALRGQPWWWYVIAVMLAGAPVVTLVTTGPAENSLTPFRRVVLPLTFVWPIFVWSAMGARTVTHRLTALVLASKYPIRQLIAEWIAGVLVAISLSSGVLILFLATGQIGTLIGFASGVLFAPSLAIAAGIWTRSSTLFEILYLVLWYIGPLNGGVVVDFVGSTTQSIEMGVPFVFVALSIVLLGMAIIRRKREVA
ncbi:ABC-2 family transporter [Natrinema hispanicum]|nr:ABC transporter permease subunit [Natrinema hispanicum]RZV12600.1 ABC-2 family transporter [Natrinema hispanicum]